MKMLRFEWDPQEKRHSGKPNNTTRNEVRRSMKSEYDFSSARKNPYAERLRQQITINLNQSTVQYFKDLAGKTGLPYQTLINLYLTDCAEKKREPEINWLPA